MMNLIQKWRAWRYRRALNIVTSHRLREWKDRQERVRLIRQNIGGMLEHPVAKAAKLKPEEIDVVGTVWRGILEKQALDFDEEMRGN